jgi:hypothetical protein
MTNCVLSSVSHLLSLGSLRGSKPSSNGIESRYADAPAFGYLDERLNFLKAEVPSMLHYRNEILSYQSTSLV